MADAVAHEPSWAHDYNNKGSGFESDVFVSGSSRGGGAIKGSINLTRGAHVTISNVRLLKSNTCVVGTCSASVLLASSLRILQGSTLMIENVKAAVLSFSLGYN